MHYTRYAIYYAPPEGSALARFGASWLGWDAAAGAETAHPVAAVDVGAVTERPRKYGFHGTLKPPFRLAEGTDADGLRAAAQGLAASLAPAEGPPLRLARLGRFCALVPSSSFAGLAEVAAACVQHLDGFRAPPTEPEIVKRRGAGLNAAQEAHLSRWGYPYVLDEFRFHLTLSGPLDDPDPVIAALEPLTAPFCTDPFEVREICLFGEAEDGRFHILARYPLGD